MSGLSETDPSCSLMNTQPLSKTLCIKASKSVITHRACIFAFQSAIHDHRRLVIYRMATASSPPVDQAANLETDIGAIWKMAIDQYEKTTTKKIDSLAGACSIDEILSEIHDKETKFKAFRHDESKLDKFRTIVKKSLAPIIALSGIVGTATSTVSNKHHITQPITNVCVPSGISP